MRELVVQAGNDTNCSDDRINIQKEITALQGELTRIASQTEFNTKKLLNGNLSATGAMKFQIGANSNQFINLSISTMSATALGVSTAAIHIATTTAATTISGYLDTIDTAINKVSEERGNLGAVQNRLEHTINNLGTASENLTAAESRIRDVDMAKEMMEFTKDNILNQAATAMLEEIAA
jgi:flagellin